jgi:hypothetical protein
MCDEQPKGAEMKNITEIQHKYAPYFGGPHTSVTVAAALMQRAELQSHCGRDEGAAVLGMIAFVRAFEGILWTTRKCPASSESLLLHFVVQNLDA